MPNPLQTRVTALLGSTYPILQTGMGWVATPELVAACSNGRPIASASLGAVTCWATRSVPSFYRLPENADRTDLATLK